MNDEIDTWDTDHVTCPHCGSELTEDEYYLENHHGLEKCAECGGYYSWDTEFSVSFFTRKVDWVHEWKNYNRTQIQIAELEMLIENEGR